MTVQAKNVQYLVMRDEGTNIIYISIIGAQVAYDLNQQIIDR